MNKAQILIQVQNELESVFQGAKVAAQRAYETATDEENEAENKYDTFGLEASYLAHGQSRRVAECEADLIQFKKLQSSDFLEGSPISIGALVCIENMQGVERYLLLSPVAGGLSVNYNGNEITLITLNSPIGLALSRHYVGDDFDVIINNDKKYYQITAIY